MSTQSTTVGAKLVIVFCGLALLVAGCSRDLPYDLDNRREARGRMAEIQTALLHFAKDVGRYPTVEEGLDALTARPSGADGWSGPYLDAVPKDPWGNDFVYQIETDSMSPWLTSYGADGQPEGEDDNADIVSSTLPAESIVPQMPLEDQ